MRLQLRNQILDVIEALLDWEEALIAKAEEHYDTLMPGYTHMQQAQPITLGHHLIAQFWLHGDDFDRLQLAFRHTNINCLGTASLAGQSWPLNRQRTTELLGFDTPTQNARVSRTYIYRAEVATAYATLMATLHYLASDFYIWYAHEFRMVEPSDEHAGSSSIMPQKKNPYVWEHTRVMARHASGWPASALAALMGASSSDSFLEPPEIERYAKPVIGYLRINTETLKRLIVSQDRAAELAREAFTTANNLADALVRTRGIDFRTAHGIAGRLVRICVNEGILPAQVDSALVDRASQELGMPPLELADSLVQEALDHRSFVQSRVTLGSANPKDVLRQVREARKVRRKQQRWFQKVKAQVEEAQAKLQAAAAQLPRFTG
jgi:argininosuccinate lyase